MNPSMLNGMTRWSVSTNHSPDTSALTLRPLSTHADYRACVRMQRDTWGSTADICVPASLLKVSQMVGGVCGGAFTADGRMVGFVYGLTGIRDGRRIHWSHMLAVAPEFRNHGVGRRLKEYQRAVLREQGIEMMYWTFDPLVARNAHLNLNRLGTQVQEYVADMYGDTGSELHASGTDRFVVSWGMTATGAAESPPSWRIAPVVCPDGDGESTWRLATAPVVRIEIPTDVETMDVTEAQVWRDATRQAFVLFLGDGYRVAGFVADAESRCYYVLMRTDAHASA